MIPMCGSKFHFQLFTAWAPGRAEGLLATRRPCRIHRACNGRGRISKHKHIVAVYIDVYIYVQGVQLPVREGGEDYGSHGRSADITHPLLSSAWPLQQAGQGEARETSTINTNTLEEGRQQLN